MAYVRLVYNEGGFIRKRMKNIDIHVLYQIIFGQDASCLPKSGARTQVIHMLPEDNQAKYIPYPRQELNECLPVTLSMACVFFSIVWLVELCLV
jgi:hypothetical protein